ncbi:MULTISPECIES: cyclase family protein [Amycolatopsis]|uniref:cyclase family protein n=1 Tax=Amycolatopsis TaxID=1813 RepID=UPI00041ACCBE|nr:cyclase family protein [Amycolatopsis thermoflava]
MSSSGNWNRWGAEDERGAANLLTPEVILAAMPAVREGRVVSLAMPIRGATSNGGGRRVPHLAGRPLPQHFMAVDGGDYAAGARKVKDTMAIADDALLVSPHGTTTHIDALAHTWRDDRLYNGHPAERVRSYGATRCGIDKLGVIVTRGLLLDVAGHLGVGHVDPGTEIDAEVLAGCASAAGVEPRAGDVVLIRTGWPRVFATDPGRYQGAQPGITYSAGRWLVDRDVVAIGADNAAVGAIASDGGFAGPVDEDIHLLTLWERGVHLIEMLALEELAATGRAEFLFVAAPLPIEGGTASPLNPVAVI